MVTSPVSASWMIAGSGPRQRSTHAMAALKPPSVNQVVHSIPRLESRTAEYGRVNGSPRSLITASQNQSTSATDFARSASMSAASCARMKRVTFACSIASGVGTHAYSVISPPPP